MRSLLLRASRSQWLADQFRRREFTRRAVRKFMPGEDVESALDACVAFERTGIGTVLTQLGERVTSGDEADGVRDEYLALFEATKSRALATHVSVKLSHLGLDIDAAACRLRLHRLADGAAAVGSFLWIDIEESSYVDATLECYRSVRATNERVGLCLQAYLRRTPADVDSLLPLKPAIRLVKGAYREPADVAFPRKSDTDDAFFAIGERLLAAGGLTVFGTHDLRLIDRLCARAGELRVPPGGYEIHMLYGIRPAEQHALRARGVVVRVLISYGAHWFPWYMRRLAERPANVWFVVKSVIA